MAIVHKIESAPVKIFGDKGVSHLMSGTSCESYALHRENYYKEYYCRNKTLALLYSRRYVAENQDKRRACLSNYQKRNRDKINLVSRRQHRHRNPDVETRSISYKHWKSPTLVREYFTSIEKDLHVFTPTDWYRISRTQIYSLGGV